MLTLKMGTAPTWNLAISVMLMLTQILTVNGMTRNAKYIVPTFSMRLTLTLNLTLTVNEP